VKKQFFLFTLFIFFSQLVFCQKLIKISGTIKDNETGETVIGAAISYSNGKGMVSDLKGNYEFKIPQGEYVLNISYVGFETIKQKIILADKDLLLNFNLQIKALDEIEIIADVAKTRETPVAFSNITIKQIQEELGTRDLPMVLNSTPGVYATEQGGGSGDARVSIRGFDQRNIAVLIDGMPVNDMESGQVFWSNWDGLGDVTRSIQVQRGLGASKLAVASVGGTMNIITKGIDSDPEISIKKEVASDLMYKTMISFNTGLLKGGWGFTGAFSRKNGEGYVDQTWTDAYSYFLKVQKRLGNHLLSFSGSGAPQRHGQRANRLPIAVYDKNYASFLGINADSVIDKSVYTTNGEDRGIKYNPHWGNLNGKPFNDRVNYFHKPQLNINHFWNITEKLNLSTVLYASFGNGGGTRIDADPTRDTLTGTFILDQTYQANLSFPDVRYHPTDSKSTSYIFSSVNQHKWYGALSNLNFKINEYFTSFVGIDLRYYKGLHYREVYDLLGGDYIIDRSSDNNILSGFGASDPNYQNEIRRKGDKIIYNYEGYVKWGGAFGQLEYKRNKVSAFFTTSISQTNYQRKDFYAPKDLVLLDTTFLRAIGAKDEIVYNDKIYNRNSPELRTSITEIVKFKGYTFKSGANYNLNKNHNFFGNIGFLKMPPRFNLVFLNTNQVVENPKMQEITSFELGYGIKYKMFAANLNVYYTNWKNKPLQDNPIITNSDGEFFYDVAINALHKGVEFDCIYKFSKKLEAEGILSIGNWLNNSSGNFQTIGVQDNKVNDTVIYSAKNIHVGDAAQIQYGISGRYNINKNVFIKIRETFFAKNYANFNLYSLRLENDFDNRDKESWKMPNYGLIDLYGGYDIFYPQFKITLSAAVFNVLNQIYISDAQNGNFFDATSTLVYMGMGRRFNASVRLTF
jgi:iron complex outermembrane recepter protein